MSGRHAEALGRAAGRDAEAGLDLVEDQDDAVALRDLADRLEVAGLGAARRRGSSSPPP
jgi:uncharacterized protein YidB (DUF937 family)